MNNSLAEVHPELVSEWSEKNLGSGNFLRVFLNIPRKLRITYVQFFVLGIYFEKLSGYTDNIKRQNC